MIDKDFFIHLITEYIKQKNRINRVEEATGWNISKWNIVRYGFDILDETLNVFFEGVTLDVIDDWLEKNYTGSIEVEENEHGIDTLQFKELSSLWVLLEQYRKY